MPHVMPCLESNRKATVRKEMIINPRAKMPGSTFPDVIARVHAYVHPASLLLARGEGIVRDVNDILRPGRRVGLVPHPQLEILLVPEPPVTGSLANLARELRQWLDPLLTIDVEEESKGVPVSSSPYHPMHGALELVVAQNLQEKPLIMAQSCFFFFFL